MTLPAHDPTQKPLPARVEQLRSLLQPADPARLAQRTGASYAESTPGQGLLHLEIWGRPVALPFPGLVAYDPAARSELSIDQQALLLYYLHTSDGTPPTGRWISFAELPGGTFYNAAFQGYSGAELARFFQSDLEAFRQAAASMGGQPVDFAQASFAFSLFPHVALLVVYWEGDDDFPASMQILFDASLPHHLPSDVAAIAGGMLARRLKKASLNLKR